MSKSVALTREEATPGSGGGCTPQKGRSAAAGARGGPCGMSSSPSRGVGYARAHEARLARGCSALGSQVLHASRHVSASAMRFDDVHVHAALGARSTFWIRIYCIASTSTLPEYGCANQDLSNFLLISQGRAAVCG